MVLTFSMCQYLGPKLWARNVSTSRLWAFTPSVAMSPAYAQTTGAMPLHRPRPLVNRHMSSSPTRLGTQVDPTSTTPAPAVATGSKKPKKLSWWKRPFARFFKQPPETPFTLPLTVLDMSNGYVGADYYLLPFTAARLFGSSEILYFMVDSGLTGTLLTTPAVEYLMPLPLKEQVQGLAGAGNIQAELFFLDRMKLNGTYPLRSTVAANVDFFQASMGERMGIDIAGMVGMEFLEQVDIEMDPFNYLCTVYEPGEPYIDETVNRVTLQGTTLPGNLIGVMLQGYRYWGDEENPVGQRAPPILGIVDTGATYSIMNWKAANALGIFEGDPRLAKESTVNMMGVEGKRQKMPLIPMQMEVCGFLEEPEVVKHESENGDTWSMKELVTDDSARIKFEANATMGIGDINFKNLLRRKEIGEYNGPACLIGQDLFMQKRWRLSGAKRTLTFDVDYSPSQWDGTGGMGR
uniref:Peptidase A1 domain-containing protein n=1 Tax=Eutreptiella gymnastica TaxID=73025 RepID=A0A7S1HYS2_9EUGL